MSHIDHNSETPVTRFVNLTTEVQQLSVKKIQSITTITPMLIIGNQVTNHMQSSFPIAVGAFLSLGFAAVGIHLHLKEKALKVELNKSKEEVDKILENLELERNNSSSKNFKKM